MKIRPRDRHFLPKLFLGVLLWKKAVCWPSGQSKSKSIGIGIAESVGVPSLDLTGVCEDVFHGISAVGTAQEIRSAAVTFVLGASADCSGCSDFADLGDSAFSVENER